MSEKFNELKVLLYYSCKIFTAHRSPLSSGPSQIEDRLKYPCGGVIQTTALAKTAPLSPPRLPLAGNRDSTSGEPPASGKSAAMATSVSNVHRSCDASSGSTCVACRSTALESGIPSMLEQGQPCSVSGHQHKHIAGHSNTDDLRPSASVGIVAAAKRAPTRCYLCCKFHVHEPLNFHNPALWTMPGMQQDQDSTSSEHNYCPAWCQPADKTSGPAQNCRDSLLPAEGNQLLCEQCRSKQSLCKQHSITVPASRGQDCVMRTWKTNEVRQFGLNTTLRESGIYDGDACDELVEGHHTVDEDMVAVALKDTWNCGTPSEHGAVSEIVRHSTCEECGSDFFAAASSGTGSDGQQQTGDTLQRRSCWQARNARPLQRQLGMLRGCSCGTADAPISLGNTMQSMEDSSNAGDAHSTRPSSPIRIQLSQPCSPPPPPPPPPPLPLPPPPPPEWCPAHQPAPGMLPPAPFMTGAWLFSDFVHGLCPMLGVPASMQWPAQDGASGGGVGDARADGLPPQHSGSGAVLHSPMNSACDSPCSCSYWPAAGPGGMPTSSTAGAAVPHVIFAGPAAQMMAPWTGYLPSMTANGPPGSCGPFQIVMQNRFAAFLPTSRES
jgi:hypothetical protein